MHIKTNNVPRFTIDAYELSEKERAEFDYLNWESIDNGNDSATFFRYKGQLYDMGEFMSVEYDEFKKWDGYHATSYFTALLIKIVDNGDSVIIGYAYN